MIIVRRSPVSGNLNVMSIDVTPIQLWTWRNGELIQRAMPDVPSEQREFIKTGITPAEWRDLFGGED